MAETERKNVLNSFHSMIYSLPPNKLYNEKFNGSLIILDMILNRYMKKVYMKCLQTPLNMATRPINSGPSEYNTYDYDNFTYEIF